MPKPLRTPSFFVQKTVVYFVSFPYTSLCSSLSIRSIVYKQPSVYNKDNKDSCKITEHKDESLEGFTGREIKNGGNEYASSVKRRN